MPERRAYFWFALVCALCLLGILAILIHGARQPAPVASDPAAQPLGQDQSSGWRRIYYRHTGIDMQYGRLAYLEPGGNGEPQFVEHMSCDAVHAAGGRGLCLHAKRGVITTYTAYVFDTGTHEIVGEFGLGGAPSRTRVSADGTLGASTVFVTGHGYDSVGFSTQTVLIDMAAAKPTADLETFSVFRDGKQIQNEDFNFWGVTFTPDGRSFFATLSTNGEHLLVKGNPSAHSLQVLHENVECPSVSPDATRVAYKKRAATGPDVRWSLYVLDLATGNDTELADDRSIDDQLEWLDNERVLYSVHDDKTPAITHVWMTRADGTGAPQLMLREAYSPAVLR